MSASKILLVDPARGGGIEWAEAGIRDRHPGASIKILRNVTAFGLRRELARERPAAFDHSVLPFRFRFLVRPGYWVQFILLWIGGVGKPLLANPDGELLSPGEAAWQVARAALPLQPLLSLVILLRLPFYLVRDILGRFALSRQDPAEPFVGFGAGKGAGGLVYWQTLTRKAKRYGLLGLAHDTYWGMPLSVHSWPLAVTALRALGYRLYFLVSALVLAGALAWAGSTNDQRWPFALIPIVLCSPYFIFNIYVGTWETLGWGLGAVAVVASLHGQPLVAGVALGGAVLAHPGVAFLVLVTLCAAAFAAGVPFLDLVLTGAVVAAVTLWYVVPYWRSRRKLGRAQIINQDWGRGAVWTRSAIYQLLLYGAVCAIAWLESGWRSQALLAIPLLVLVYNTRIRWVFSMYTVTNYMLVAGGLYAMAHPTTLGLIAYLALIYTGPWLLWTASDQTGWEFDLVPVRIDDAARPVRELFAGLGEGRVAFESHAFGNEASRSVGVLTYILADQPVELMNAGYAEIGDAALYQRFTRHFNAETDASQLASVCQDAGVRYLVAFSPEFRRALREAGHREVGVLDSLALSSVPGRPAVSLALFEMPALGALAEDPPDLVMGPNQGRFVALAGRRYRLRLTAFAGWRAFQGPRALPLQDGAPGLVIEAPEDGEVVVRYRYRHYWGL